MTMEARNEMAFMGRKAKGKNFTIDEEWQLCRSFLHISLDPTTGNGQKSAIFWDRIIDYFNSNRLSLLAERSKRGLETKWGSVKHYVSKFVESYKQVLGLNAFGTSPEDHIQQSLDLYKQKHMKNLSFVFLHCWLILKDISRWNETREERSSLSKETPMKRRMSMEESEPKTVIDDLPNIREGNSKRQRGSKNAKDKIKQQKVRDAQLRAQSKAPVDMATTFLMRAKAQEDANAMALFSMLGMDYTDEANAYFELRRKEELQKLKVQLSLEDTVDINQTAQPIVLENIEVRNDLDFESNREIYETQLDL